MTTMFSGYFRRESPVFNSLWKKLQRQRSIADDQMGKTTETNHHKIEIPAS